MHILTLSSLFPNPLMPVHAVFVRARMEAYTKQFGHDWTVVAPIPYFPRFPFRKMGLYGIYARVPREESPWGYPLYHPRYLVTPKVGMRFYGEWMARGVRDLVHSIHKERPIDLIDGHYIYPDGSAAVTMGRELGIPVILSARGTDLNLYPHFPAVRKILSANMQAASHVICVCTELKVVAEKLGTPGNKISVIGNGVDTALFRAGDRDEARRRLGLPMYKKIFLSVGGMTERKGFHISIEAFANLKLRDGLLIIAGSGPEAEALARLAANLGIKDQVLFPGAIGNSQLPPWYQASDYFILASSREGWPNVLCEAQACGLPSITTNAWGMPEIVSNAKLGILVDARTVSDFGRALTQALVTEWDRKYISSVGSSRSWQTVGSSLEEVFQKALRVGYDSTQPT